MRTFILSALLFMFMMPLMAQPPGPPPPGAKPNMEKVKQMRTTFINQKLNLSEQEKAIFWPLFDKYLAEKKQLMKPKFSVPMETIDFSVMSTAELNEYIESQLQIKEKQAALERKYMTEFKKILPLVKTARLMTIEEEFRMFLMKQAKEKMGPGGPPPGRPGWGND